MVVSLDVISAMKPKRSMQMMTTIGAMSVITLTTIICINTVGSVQVAYHPFW